MKKQIIKNFIIVMILIALVLIVISEISYVSAVSPESYKPSQMPSSSLNEPIISMKSKVTSLIFIIIITALIYFIPTTICLIRNHTYKLYIICLNIILGWTLICWIGCLIWAFIDKKTITK